MKSLLKLTSVIVLSLFLANCAHHGKHGGCKCGGETKTECAMGDKSKCEGKCDSCQGKTEEKK